MYADHNALPRVIYGDLDRVARPDLHYHYSGTLCAHRWLDVCCDPAYGHATLLRRIRTVFPSLIQALLADGDDIPCISFVSLGPGDGSLDEEMLRRIDEAVPLSSYCALDFSFELLRLAINRMVRANGFRGPFSIQAVCGDFTELGGELADGVSEEGCGARLFGLTGFTLGNYGEEDLLERIAGLMGANDYLFLDARLHRLGSGRAERVLTEDERSDTLRNYDLPSVRRFVFGPVEMATLATSEEVEIDFDLLQTPGSIPGAMQVLIYCKGLESRLRLTGEPVRRERLDLAVTTLYHYPDLLTRLVEIGFSLVWHQDVDGVAMILLRAPKHRALAEQKRDRDQP